LANSEVRRDNAVLRADVAGELALVSGLIVGMRVVDGGPVANRIGGRRDSERRCLIGSLRLTAGTEEPQTVSQDVAAQGLLVDVGVFVDRLFLSGERRQFRPTRIGHAVAER